MYVGAAHTLCMLALTMFESLGIDMATLFELRTLAKGLRGVICQFVKMFQSRLGSSSVHITDDNPSLDQNVHPMTDVICPIHG